MALLEGSEVRGKFAAARKSVGGWGILDAGQRVIAEMLLTTGTGEPERGHGFAQSALQFRGAEQTVASARPTRHWTGAAARAYADANARQADRAVSMAVLDKGLHAVIAREAEQISHRRENLGGQAAHLADLRSAAGSMGRVPGIGRALRSAIELTAVNAALGTSRSELRELTREVGENAAALQEIAGEYVGLTLNPQVPEAEPERRGVGASSGTGTAESEEHTTHQSDKLGQERAPAATRPPR
jgi:EspA/EspE family